jgi:xanthine/uracil permease
MHEDYRWSWLPAELLIFTAFGHAAHVLTSIPPWVGGGVSALLVGVLLRLLDPMLRDLGEKLRDRKK